MVMNTFECGVCGADVPAKAIACPECGADDQTGLHGDAPIGGLDLPDEDTFDYDAFAEREFGTPRKRSANEWIIAAIAIVLIIALLMMFL